MKRYKDILADLGHDLGARLSDPRLTDYLPTYVAPAEWYGFPPALLPIASDGSLPAYLGVWRHWFGSRTDSYVSMSLEDYFRVTEMARKPDQLADQLVLSGMVLVDGVTESIRMMADWLGGIDLALLGQHAIAYGDLPQYLHLLPSCATRTPLIAVTDGGYDGEFPVPGRVPDNVSWFEFDEERFGDALPAGLPDWIDPTVPRSAVFQRHLSEGRLDRAWLTLNSPGWMFRDAADALEELGRRHDDPLFRRMAAVWTDHAREDDAGY